MKNIILLTIILVFQSFSSFGSPNEKGLVCECLLCPELEIEFGTYYEGNKPSVYMYYFDDYKVTHLQVTKLKKNNQIVIRESVHYKTIPFTLSLNFIQWGDNYSNSYKYKLNRETLILEKTMVGRKKPGTIRQCNVYTKTEFLEVQKEIISNYQKNVGKTFGPKKKYFEKKLNKNKI